MDKRDFGEIRGQFAKQDIFCKDCKYRDRTAVQIGKKIIYSGVTRDTCEKYVAGENRKPYSVLFQGERCAFYSAEE